MRNIARLEPDDPRLLPAYTVQEASHYLRLPEQTLRYWVRGRNYRTRAGLRRSLPVLAVPDRKRCTLSFVNLVEAHLLAAITRDHDVSLQRVRRAVTYLRRALGSDHPLIERSLETNKRDLFIWEAGMLINISQEGQTAMREVLDTYLSRIEWDTSGLAARLYPFTAKTERSAPKAVLIDPRLAFGRPVLSGTGVPTEVIAERFKAGESLESLAPDYGRAPAEILEAIRCELELAA